MLAKIGHLTWPSISKTTDVVLIELQYVHIKFLHSFRCGEDSILPHDIRVLTLLVNQSYMLLVGYTSHK